MHLCKRTKLQVASKLTRPTHKGVDVRRIGLTTMHSSQAHATAPHRYNRDAAITAAITEPMTLPLIVKLLHGAAVSMDLTWDTHGLMPQALALNHHATALQDAAQWNPILSLCMGIAGNALSSAQPVSIQVHLTSWKLAQHNRSRFFRPVIRARRLTI